MSEYDSPWKEFLDYYLKAFLEFGFCDLHDQIDWSKEVVMRDKELQQIAPESESGLRVVDKLAESTNAGRRDKMVTDSCRSPVAENGIVS